MIELDQLAFEVERFDFPDDDHIEVTGRWFGTGGRRFMRPTLHVRVDGRRRRMLALLDHKPWSPEDPTWVAAFAWRGTQDGVTSARLEVSPDIILDLPKPGEAEPGTTVTPKPRPAREPKKPPTAPKPVRAAEPPVPAPREAPAPAPTAEAPPREAAAPAPAAAAELRVLALERRLAEERGEREHVQEELAGVRRQLEAQASHQASAVERAEEVVRLEGELTAATARAERAESERAAELADAVARAERAEAALARIDEPLEPLSRRIRPRTAAHREWSPTQRIAVAATLFVALGLVLILLLTQL